MQIIAVTLFPDGERPLKSLIDATADIMYY